MPLKSLLWCKFYPTSDFRRWISRALNSMIAQKYSKRGLFGVNREQNTKQLFTPGARGTSEWSAADRLQRALCVDGGALPPIVAGHLPNYGQYSRSLLCERPGARVLTGDANTANPDTSASRRSLRSNNSLWKSIFSSKEPHSLTNTTWFNRINDIVLTPRRRWLKQHVTRPIIYKSQHFSP